MGRGFQVRSLACGWRIGIFEFVVCGSVVHPRGVSLGKIVKEER